MKEQIYISQKAMPQKQYTTILAEKIPGGDRSVQTRSGSRPLRRFDLR